MIKSMIITLVMIILIPSSHLFASGTMILDGELKAFSTKTLEISDGNSVFTVDRSKISETKNKELKKINRGSKISLQLPFNAITDMQPVKK